MAPVLDENSPLLAQDEVAAAPPVLPSYTEGSVGAQQPQPQRGWKLLATLCPVMIGTFLAAMDGTIVASSYARIGSDLKQLQNTSWIATAYMLSQTSFQPLYGKMSDIFGRKACLLFAYVVFGIGCLGCGMAQNMTQLIIARAFAGIGGGGMTTVVSILVSDVVPLRERGTWQGILNIIFATGSASGAPLGGFLADSIGWRWSFLGQVPLTFLAFVAVLFALHLPPLPKSNSGSSAPSRRSKLARIDFPGALTLVLAVFSLLFGLDRGGNVSWSSPSAYIPLIISAVLWAAFLVIECYAAEAFAPPRIVTNGSLIAAYLCNFFGFVCSMSAVFNVSLYAQAVRGTTAAVAGATLLPGIIAGVSGSLASGIIMQRTGRYKALTIGSYAVLVVGTACLDLVVGGWLMGGGLIGAAIGLFLISSGQGVGITTTLIALIANVTPEDQAISTAVSYLFRSLGSVIGVSVGSSLVQNTLRSYLSERLSNSDVDEIVRKVRESLGFIDTLNPMTQAIVREGYAKAVGAAFWLATAAGVCTFLSSMFINEKSLDSWRGGR